MITVNIRKQGGAAVMTIPSDVLKMLDISVGATLEIDVGHGAFTARPVSQPIRKHYSLADLLRGVTPELAEEITAETDWAREGDPVGREIL